jgi:hypothetical protein
VYFLYSHISELEIVGDEAVMVYFRYLLGVTEENFGKSSG